MKSPRFPTALVAVLLVTGISVSAIPAAAKRARCLGRTATITGSAGKDTLKGTSGNDVIAGLGGKDRILGRGGNDLICGGGGHDNLQGEGGNDRISGGEAHDDLYGQEGDDEILGDAGNDYIEESDGDDVNDGGAGPYDSLGFELAPGPVEVDIGTGTTEGFGSDTLSAVEVIIGSPFDDTLLGSPESDEFYGGDGDDFISGADGFDYMLGQGGNDTLEGGEGEYDTTAFLSSDAPIQADLTAGTATGEGSDTLSGIEVVGGSRFNDTLTGTDGNDQFNGWLGDDRFFGKEGFDAAIFSEAAGPVVADAASGTATGDGDDTFESIEGFEGSRFDDTLTGSNEPNDLIGGPGDDTLRGLGADDYIEAGAGDDLVDGGEGLYDMLSFIASRAPVDADLSAGTATGDGTDDMTGIEIIGGSPHDDALAGDDKDNLFFGFAGNDTISAGEGFDVMLYDVADGPINADLTSGIATGEGSDILSGFEGVLGSPFDDTLAGDDSSNVLVGIGGDDTIIGRGGDDWIELGSGDDNVDGGAGDYDAVDYSFSAAAVQVNLTTGIATGEGSDELAGIEELYGSPFDDTLIGNGLSNFLFGGEGDDSLNGAEGDDGLDGDDGTDSLNGAGGTDQCFAGESLTSCEESAQPEENSTSQEGRDSYEFFSRHR